KKPFVFGASSRFGAPAFSSLKNKKNDNKNKDKDKDIDNKNENENDNTNDTKNSKTDPSNINSNNTKIIKLEKKIIKSGEEDEINVFQCKAKLYVLDLTNFAKSWSERGTGSLSIKKNLKNSNSRIIMRSAGILKLILNCKIIHDFKIFKGMESSLNGEKFIRFNNIETSLNNDNQTTEKFVQYAIKVSNAEVANDLYSSIIKLIPQ
ncbi:Yrb2p, partial [Ascoidea rubescens DSM 1968]